MVSKVLLSVLSVLVGLFIVGLLIMQALSIGISLGMGPCIWLCAAVFPTLLLMIFAHEAGHFVAGKLVGLSFARFVLAPLEIAPQRPRFTPFPGCRR